MRNRVIVAKGPTSQREPDLGVGGSRLDIGDGLEVLNTNPVDGIDGVGTGLDVPKGRVDVCEGAERNIRRRLLRAAPEGGRPSLPVADDGVANIVFPAIGGTEILSAIALAVLRSIAKFLRQSC